jgi:hypothetical protein
MNRWETMVLCALLAGCGGEMGWEPIPHNFDGVSPEQAWANAPVSDVAAPPAELSLCKPPFLVPGQLFMYTVTGVAPGERVWFARGTDLVADGACFDMMGGVCTDVADPAVMGSVVADETGTATYAMTMPLAVPPGYQLAVQSWVRRGTGGADTVKTNATLHTVTASTAFPRRMPG